MTINPAPVPLDQVPAGQLTPLVATDKVPVLRTTPNLQWAYVSELQGLPGMVAIYPSGDATGATDTAAIQAALNTGAVVYLAPGVFYTSATLTVTTAAQSGQKLCGAGALDFNGLGSLKTVIRPTAAVSVAVKIDGAPNSFYIEGVKVEDLTVDMVNMTDASTSIAFDQGQAFDVVYSRTRVINFGNSKFSHQFRAGSYTTALNSCAGGLLNFQGASFSNETTTITVNACDFAGMSHDYFSNVTFVGGAMQRVYSTAVPMVYLAPGVTPYEYAPNTAGLYAAILSDIIDSQGFTSIGMDWENGGGVPTTYNDGTHGTLNVVAVVRVQSTAINTTFINPTFAGCYLLDYGMNTRLMGQPYSGGYMNGFDLTSGDQFFLGKINAFGLIQGVTSLANYLDYGTGATFSINGATGAATLQTVKIQPGTDQDKAFSLYTAGGTLVIDFSTQGGTGNLAINNGVQLSGYSDSFTTLKWQLRSDTGAITGVSLTASAGNIVATSGYFNGPGGYYVASTKVVGAQATGWTAATGTAAKGAYATYAGQTQGATYSQTAIQALDNAVLALSQRVLALDQMLANHGLKNA